MDTPVPIVSRLQDVGVSIFAVMTRLALEHGAINLSQGFPDFSCDPDLVEAVSRHMRAGENQYAPMPGVLALREALSAKIRRLYGAEYDPATELTVTSGATEALFDSHLGVCPPGRRGDPLRAVLRLVRAGGAAQRRHAPLRHAPRARTTGSTGRRSAGSSRRARACSSSTLPTTPPGRSSRPTTCARWRPRSTARASSC